VLVNPHDIEGMAQAFARAFAMPLEERRERWTAMMATLRGHSVQKWFAEFVASLKGTRPVEQPAIVTPAPAPAVALAYRPERPAVGLP
jgi:trehalose 6-phosphate synthase